MICAWLEETASSTKTTWLSWETDLADAGRALGLTVHVENSVHDALALARGLVNARGLIVITGSLYTVGAAREEILAGAVRWEDAGR